TSLNHVNKARIPIIRSPVIALTQQDKRHVATSQHDLQSFAMGLFSGEARTDEVFPFPEGKL
ncbi:Hypothetical predicted protein, partial [Paramuricea clavata]